MNLDFGKTIKRISLLYLSLSYSATLNKLILFTLTFGKHSLIQYFPLLTSTMLLILTPSKIHIFINIC